MPELPSEPLANMLARLRLATGGQLRSVSPLVARLAGELTHFDSVWVDALAQARILTRFQAAEINAGRGPALAVGGHVLSAPLAGPAYARAFAAVRLDTRAPARLLVADHWQASAAEVAAGLERLVERGRLIEHPALAAVTRAGIEQGRVWAASPPADGVSAARWMTENGRLPSDVVLHVARRLAGALAELETLEMPHGDLSPLGLILRADGRVTLPHPGLRPILQPMEGYAFGDLQPEAYDTLAPERIDAAAPISVATEVYAFGCLCWNLAAGRPPLAGGATIAKLKAVHRGKAIDIARLAPDLPARLAEVVRACMTFSPADRPPSFAAIGELLGPAPRRAHRVARQQLARPQGPRRLWSQRKTATRGQQIASAAAVGLSLALLFAGSVAWRYRREAFGLLGSPSVAARSPKLDLRADRPKRAASPSPTAGGALATASPSESAPGSPPEVGGARQASYAAARVPVEPRLLSTGGPLRLAELRLQRGQTVRGAHGRPLVIIPAAGLRVEGEEICFENIDFVWEGEFASEGGGDTSGAGQSPSAVMLRLSAELAEFRSCTFHDAARRGRGAWNGQPPPTAIRWDVPPTAGGHSAVPPAGELRIGNCVFWSVDAAIECEPGAGLSIDARQSLLALSGPWLRLTACPRRAQSVSLRLTNATCRASLAVVECPSPPESPDNPAEPSFSRPGRGVGARWDVGRISVEAVDSVFALPADGAALLLLDGPNPPRQLLSHIEWTGQGSLVTTSTPIAAWREDVGKAPRTLAEEELEVAGLVRGQVEFLGDSLAGPEAARLRRWQAPLRSSQPPGIGAGRLSLPELGAAGLR